MDFLNMDLPPEEEDKSNPLRFDAWFDFMNNQMEIVEEKIHQRKINKLLTTNGIDPLEID